MLDFIDDKELGPALNVTGLAVDFDADFTARADGLAGGGEQGFLNGFEQRLAVDAAVAFELFKAVHQFTFLHGLCFLAENGLRF